MANVFSGNPYDAQLAAMGAAKPKPAQDPRKAIEGVATKYNVPANVLLALDEAAGGTGQQAEAFAREIADGMKAGKSVDAILAEKAGDPTRAAALMNRAYDIADELYPAPAAPAPVAGGSSVAGDLSKQVRGSIVKGGGAMIEGLGQGVDAAVNAAGSIVNPVYAALTGGDIGQTTAGRDAGVAAGDSVRAYGDSIQSGISPEGRQALMDSTPDGDIMKPSTYSLGKNPSLRGYAMLGADVLGSLLPVVATAVITKSPAAAAAVGGSMGGGSGAETARDIVQGMAKEVGPDGRSKLETESALYRELVAGGASPEQALDRVTREAERLAFLFTTPISAFGGAATAKIIQGGATAVGKRGLAGRVAGTAALSGIEEGVQEAAESMAARYGTSQGAQMPLDITEGTFGDFILGALGGAPVGAVSGLASGRAPGEATTPPAAEQPPAPLALPAPNNGGTIFGAAPPPPAEPAPSPPPGPLALPSPTNGGTLFGGPPPPQEPTPPPPPPIGLPAPNRGGTIIAPGPVGPGPRDPTNFERDPNAPRQTLSDGSGQGQAAALGSSPVPPPVAGAAAEPLGPISAIAAAAPDLTPLPEVEPVEVPPMFSEMKPGTQVRLQTPDGNVIDAVFQREEGESAVVRIGGQEVALDPAAFDTAVQGARQADLEAEAKAKGEKVAKPKAPAKLSDQTAPSPDLSRQEAAANEARAIEARAKVKGWTERARKRYDGLVAIAGKAASPKPAGSSDVPVSVGVDQPPAQQPNVDPETSKVLETGAAQGRPDPAGLTAGSTPDDGVDGAADASKPGTALAADDFDANMTDTMIAVRAAIRDKKPAKRARNQVTIGGMTIPAEDYDRQLTNVREEQKQRGEMQGVVKAAIKTADPFGSAEPVSAKTLPGRQSKGVEMAAIEVRKADDGKFVVKRSFNLADRGTTGALGQKFDTAADAESAAVADIEARMKSAIADPNANEQTKADARAVMKWLGKPAPDPAPGGRQKPSDVRQNSSKAVKSDTSEAAPNTGILSTLSQEKQDRGAELKAKLAAKARSQTSSGLDPEYITLGGELVALYIEAGTKKFGAMLRDFAESTGLSMREAQVPMRAAYSHVRGEMDLNGEDITGMDSDLEVMAEIKAVLAAERAQDAPKPSSAAQATDDPFVAAGFEVGKDPAARSLADSREGKEGKWVVRQFGEGKFRVTKTNKQVGSVAIPTRVIGNFDSPEEAIAAVRADGASLPAPEVPTAKEVAAAATVTDPEPTKAQAEAENYRTGKVEWNGLTLSIENKKGGTRRGYKDDGSVAWEVTMPAHYGRILRTEGADGDHVDFYLGDVTDSDYVMVIDQVDAETGAFDEHKLIMGTTARGAALGVYRDAFSDGKADKRIGGFTETNVGTLKAWLKTADMSKPSKPLSYPFAAKDYKTAAPGSDAEIRAALVKGLEGTPVTHITKRGRELTGIIIVNPMLVPAQAQAIDARAFRKTGDNGGGWFIRASDARAYLGEEAPNAENANSQDAAPDAPAATPKPARPKTETLQKRPLIHRVRQEIGQIDPDSPFGREAYFSGLNAQSAPGLFRRGGLTDLDNLVAEEHKDIALIVGTKEDGYLDEARLLALMLEEIAGKPAPIGGQLALQQNAKDREAQASLERQVLEAGDLAAEQEAGTGYEPVVTTPLSDYFIADPETDIRTGTMDRTASIRDAVADIVEAYDMSALTPEEIGYIVAQLDVAGGSVLAAIEQTIVRGYNDEARREESDQPSGKADTRASEPPFGPEDEAGDIEAESGRVGSADQPDAEPATSGGGSDGQRDTETPDQVAATPAFEPGADGLPQAIMPGMEGGADQRQSALTARQKAEIEARQKQSKMRRLGGNGGDAGPLFGDGPKDLFDAPAAPREPDFVDRFNAAKAEGMAKQDAERFPTTLEDITAKERKQRAGERLSYVYAEYRGQRFYLGAVSGNGAGPIAEWRVTFPQAAVYATDRADGTSINGEIRQLEDAIAAQESANQPAQPQSLFDDLPAPAKANTSAMSEVEKVIARRDEFIQDLTREVNRVEKMKWAAYAKTGRRSASKASVSQDDLADKYELKKGGAFIDVLVGSVTLGIPMERKANYYDDVKQIVEAYLSSRSGQAAPAEQAPASAATPEAPSNAADWLGPKWDAMDPSSRAALVMAAGWTVADGTRENPTGKSIARRDWADQAEMTKETLARFADRLGMRPDAAAPAAPAAQAKPDAKITDFGEKIGGARKDVWSGFKEKMEEAEALDVAAEPLSKSWPEPDYAKLIEAGIDPWTVSFVRAAREMIPRKPAKSWKLRGWVDQVKVLRTFANGLLTERIDKADLQAKLEKYPDLNKKIAGKIALYDAVGHGETLKELDFGEQTYSMLNGVYFDKPRTFWEVTKDQAATVWSNMPKTLARGDTRDEALAKFKERYESIAASMAPKKASGTKFLIYHQRGAEGAKYKIGVKIGSNYVDLRTGIADVKEARRIVAEEANQLQEKLDAMRTVPNERRDENAPRLGADHRSGADVSPEQFAETFGFRGVEFGNWVEQGRRKQDLNDAYDALMDLASILDIPPKAISLNGSLGLAFGARGAGGKNPAAAHFEPGKVVINLTKRSGRGSLAHEWFHALDNYFARKRTPQRGTYITENSSPGGPLTQGIRPETVDAFLAVKRAIANTKLKERSSKIDQLRSSPYWGTGIEMHARAFESYVIAKLQDQSASNDYLANIVNGLAWSMQAEMSGLGDAYPYLKPEEIETVRPKFDALFAAMERRETDKGVALEMREDAQPVATLTGNELGPWEDIRQLGKMAEKWYRDNLSGKTAVNADKNWTVTFTNAGARKVGGRKGEDLYRMVPALRQIIERGVVILTEPDTKGNDTVKAWHTISARVEMDGRTFDVVAKVKETAQGHFHYDLSGDSVAGARFGTSISPESRAYGLEDNPGNLNLQFSSAEINADEAPITDDDMRGITRDMNAELAASGLAGKVSVRVVRRLISHVTGNQIQGRFNEGGANIEVRAGAAAGERGVMRHEIIHALRAEALWNKPYGLFTGPEWRDLVKAARAEPEIVASVEERYPNLSAAAQSEEMVAELYRLWAEQRDGYDGVAKALGKIEAFLQAMANLLRGRGFGSAALTMERIAGGKIGGRGPQGPGGGRRNGGEVQSPPLDGAEMRALPGAVRDKFKGLVGFRNWRDPKEVLRNITTDAMTGDTMTVLALVPGRALFAELSNKLLSSKRYIRAKEEMDTLRNDWHAEAAGVAQKWIDMQAKDPAANDAMMDLMHRSTMTGVDPSKADTWGKDDNFLRNAKMEVSRLGDKAPDWAKEKMADFEKRKTSYAAIKALYDALPPEYQAFYVEVKDSYEKMADDFDQALEDNIKQGAKMALKRAEKEHRKTLRQIEDDGLTGEEKAKAIDEATATLDKVRARANSGAVGQVKAMRKVFEGQRLKGPYFPLARFGDYFVTVRDEDGKVINFSRFENEKRQQVFRAEQEELHPGRVSFGLMSKKGDMRDQVDPKFVSDVEMLLADSGASTEVMDAIWQRYLETMPDQSIRTSKIHRKGREGFNRDALRSYTSHTFHGAHQLARLKYGLELQDSLDDAEDEARRADDPNRATALVNEMRKRMDWTMNPTGSQWSAAASSLAFVWYLGVSPAAALVNLTQTTVIGPAVMKAGLKNASLGKITAELGRAAKDFGKGQGNTWRDTWTAENAPGVTADEKAAMQEGYRRGTIDKTQAHDLAAVAESGVEFSPFREKWMRRIGFAFHHAERINREVTYLAAYRLAKAEGMNHTDAIEKASDLTWKTHFSYQNSDRPRFMQQDIPKVIFIFRQFSVNLLYRLFRDAHQSLAGKTKAERKEARTQLVGISLSMMAHAGIKGVWGYALIMGLLSLFFPGDADDLEEWMQDALLMEGDGMGVAAANYAMGAFLNGVPGQLTGAALTERIGSPNLWFRGSDRNLEGEDVVQHYINELAGPIGGIAYSVFGRGIPDVLNGEVVRGVESLTPKFVRDVIRTGRFGVEGATTRNGDTLIEHVNPWELILQANGFTPARLAERYDINTRLKNKEREITDERKDLHRAASDALKEGGPIPEKVMNDIRDFNSRFPEYPITGDTIRQSFAGRMRASERNEFGVSLNPRLNDRLRGDLAPALYNG